MNLHPLFVHFPIALLSLYALLEVLRFPMLTRQVWYEPSKALLLISGTIGAFFSLWSGEIASEVFRGTSTMVLVSTHEFFAKATTWLFLILTCSYLLRSLATTPTLFVCIPASIRPIFRIEQVVFRVPVRMLLAFLGFLFLLITGALGGAIVYGPETDHIVSFFYHLLLK